MSAIDDARKTLHAFLEDMAALKQFADPSNAQAAPFTAAFAAARARAMDAAKVYADAANAS